MEWVNGDHGFAMTRTKQIPRLIEKQLHALGRILAARECAWALNKSPIGQSIPTGEEFKKQCKLCSRCPKPRLQIRIEFAQEMLLSPTLHLRLLLNLAIGKRLLESCDPILCDRRTFQVKHIDPLHA